MVDGEKQIMLHNVVELVVLAFYNSRNIVIVQVRNIMELIVHAIRMRTVME